jgi:hypothetical protein
MSQSASHHHLIWVTYARDVADFSTAPWGSDGRGAKQ